MTLRAVLDRALALLLAPPCAICDRVLDRPLSGAVCAGCWNAISPRPCAFSLHLISRAGAIGDYEGTLREVIHVLKYDGRRSVAPPLAGLMATHGREVLHAADALVPVPLHRTRLRQRGFNQAEDLARHLALPVVGALKRVRATHPQVDLPADARRDNVKDAFALAGTRVQARIARRIVVLVDDVATTGATLEACARVLTRAGASEVRALTAARVANGRR
jgi:ComF family protein